MIFAISVFLTDGIAKIFSRITIGKAFKNSFRYTTPPILKFVCNNILWKITLLLKLIIIIEILITKKVTIKKKKKIVCTFNNQLNS